MICKPKGVEHRRTPAWHVARPVGSSVCQRIQRECRVSSEKDRFPSYFPPFSWATVPRYEQFADSNHLLTYVRAKQIASSSSFIVGVRATTWLWRSGEASRLQGLFCGVGSGGEFGQGLDGAVSEAGQDVGEVFANRHAQPAATFDGAEDGGDFRSCFLTAQVEPVSAAQGNFPDILPMSGRNLRFTIVGTRSMGGRFAIVIANNVAPGVLSTWTTAQAWSRWFPHGCWIQ